MADERLVQLGQRLRIDSVRAAAAGGSGHPTSSMSASDLLAVLLAKHLRYDFDSPENPNNDHLIFSKGHASPLLYAMFRAVEAVSEEELFSYRKLHSRLQGHPTPALPWVDVATGSLGQGLPIALGVALAARDLDRLDYHTWCICGDSEMAEGSIWEAVDHAGFLGLDHLIAIVDVNRLGQRGQTMHGWNLGSYARRAEASGWRAIEIDGHDIDEIDQAMADARANTGSPTMIVARTLKGKGVKEVEDLNGFHGKPLDNPEQAVAELGDVPYIPVEVHKPESDAEPHVFETDPSTPTPTYELGGKAVATRRAFGDALTALMQRRGEVVALDGEVGNSTYVDLAHDAVPERTFEMFIAEQQMIGTAVGFQVRNWMPFSASFAAFLSRAYDFVRMAAISQATMALCGSHSGVSIGEDGPSQMALEDLAEFRAIGGSTVLYPSDPNQTARLVDQMAELEGISYMRTTRAALPTLYGPEEEFPVGGARVVRESDEDQVMLVGAGITVHEALKAADALAEDGINARVVDAYSVKPLDVDTLRAAARDTGGRVVVVEDHWPEGGLGDAVLGAFADTDERPRVVKLAVTHLPGSGTPDELMHECGIDAEAIAAAGRRLAELGPQVGASTPSAAAG